MPPRENSVFADKPWNHKAVLYRLFGASTISAAKAMSKEASKQGIQISNTANDIVENAKHLPMAQALGAYAGNWDLEFVRKRSENLAGLAWETLNPWLQETKTVKKTRPKTTPKKTVRS